MSTMFRITVKGIKSFNGASQAIFDTVKDCMDVIRDDVSTVSRSLTPRKSGQLEESQYVRRYYKNLDKCYFTVSYRRTNKGFDVAKWTHDADYNLGAGSRAKRPVRSKFASGSLRVGQGYLSQVVKSSEDAWTIYINANVAKNLRASIKKNGG